MLSPPVAAVPIMVAVVGEGGWSAWLPHSLSARLRRGLRAPSLTTVAAMVGGLGILIALLYAAFMGWMHKEEDVVTAAAVDLLRAHAGDVLCGGGTGVTMSRSNLTARLEALPAVLAVKAAQGERWDEMLLSVLNIRLPKNPFINATATDPHTGVFAARTNDARRSWRCAAVHALELSLSGLSTLLRGLVVLMAAAAAAHPLAALGVVAALVGALIFYRRYVDRTLVAAMVKTARDELAAHAHVTVDDGALKDAVVTALYGDAPFYRRRAKSLWPSVCEKLSKAMGSVSRTTQTRADGTQSPHFQWISPLPPRRLSGGGGQAAGSGQQQAQYRWSEGGRTTPGGAGAYGGGLRSSPSQSERRVWEAGEDHPGVGPIPEIGHPIRF